jgi:biotin carboxyl carrier protein
MNEIKAQFKFKVIKVLFKDKAGIEANQDLFIIEKL